MTVRKTNATADRAERALRDFRAMAESLRSYPEIDGRAIALAITKAEEALMWFQRSVDGER